MKMTKFECSACRQPLEAPEDMGGMEIDCPACQAKVTIPHHEVDQKTGAKSGGRKLILIGSALCAAALLIGLGTWIGVMLALRQHSVPKPSTFAPAGQTATEAAAQPAAMRQPENEAPPVVRAAAEPIPDKPRTHAPALTHADVDALTQMYLQMEQQRRAAAAAQQAPKIVCPDCQGRGCWACGLRGYRSPGVMGNESFSPFGTPK